MVNGRNMRHPYFHKAIMQCYERLIPADEQPNYFINLTVDPETIDVNIHPTKNEIKFENEQPIWQILSAAVRESLGRFNAAPAIDFDVEDAPEIPAFVPDTSATHEVELDDSYNPFAQGSGGARRVSKMSAIADDQEPYSPFAPSGDTADSPSFRTADPSAPGSRRPAGGAPTSRTGKNSMTTSSKNAMTAMPRWSKAKSTSRKPKASLRWRAEK